MAATEEVSLVSTFDDIQRCMRVLFDSTPEEEFLRFLELHEKYRANNVLLKQDAERLQKELDASLQSMADMESKLFHARRLLENEIQARTDAELQRDQMEKKIVAISDMLQNEHNLNDETKDKLATLSRLPRKRKSINKIVEQKYGADINSTGSFLSNLSLTQSEDDFLNASNFKVWYKHRPSKGHTDHVAGKRSRPSTGVSNTPVMTSSPMIQTRRSVGRRNNLAANVEHHSIEVHPQSERICATTKVTIPQDGSGAIRAESTIESLPLQSSENKNMESVISKEPITPMKSSNAKIAMFENGGTPAHQIRSTLMRKHNFVTKTFIRSDTCMQCQKKIRFGAIGLRCRDCSIRCHVDCRYLLTTSCVPQTNTPTVKGAMGYIADYAPSVPPMIPALIVHCVNEIETRGLNEVGLYRVPGSEREVKALKERFLRGKTTPYLANVEVHVLCGCIKDFLRSLREPLIPTKLWPDFCNAVQNFEEADIRNGLYEAIDKLPQPNRDTLAFLILHFQRIAECPDILMPILNIARVFGPTIVGYSSADPDQNAIFMEISTQCAVMENLLKIPMTYWTQFVAVNADKENINSTITETPKNKQTIASLYATPLKSTVKKRRFYASPPRSSKK